MELLRRERYRPRVLLADADRLLAENLRSLLDTTGFDAAVAYDGQAAVETARAWRFDIFLSEVAMPRMNGIEAAVEIQAILPECRVLLFSGAAAARDLQRDARILAHSFEILAKPIAPAELMARLWCSLAPGY